MSTTGTNDVVRYLDGILGESLVEFLSGADKQLVPLWKTGEATPNQSALERLECAAEVLRTIARAETSDDARSWFIGPNVEVYIDCKSYDLSPCEAVRSGNFHEVREAAKRIVHTHHEPSPIGIFHSVVD